MKQILLFLFLIPSFLFAQKTTILKGTVKNSQKEGIDKVSVKFGNTGTVTDENGNYSIRIPLDKETTILFSHVSYVTFTKKITAKNRNIIRFSPILLTKTDNLNEVVVKDNRVIGLNKAHPAHIRGQVKAMVASFQHLGAVLEQTQIGEDKFVAKHFFRHVLVALPIRADHVVAFLFETFCQVRGCVKRKR